MYFDLDDHRPDTPRVPSGLSRLERVSLSVVGHGLLVAAIVFFPARWLESRVDPRAIPPSEDAVRYVDIRPAVERPATPKPRVDQSDMDRRSTAPVRPPKAESPTPYSQGNTADKVIGAPEEKPAGPPAPQPSPAAAEPAPPSVAAKVVPDIMAAPPQPAAGSLGESLRNLKRYLQDQNLDNQKGGLVEQGPDIQFDSKGVEFGPWLRRFVTQVKSNWFVPDSAAFLKGRVVIQFNVHKDGRITDLRVVAPCPYESFNAAALNSLRLSNPTLALPPEYPSDKAFFTVTFHYNEGA
jgi:TonB family protein